MYSFSVSPDLSKSIHSHRSVSLCCYFCLLLCLQRRFFRVFFVFPYLSFFARSECMCVIVWHGLPDYPKKIELRRVVSFARVVSFYLLFDFSLGVFYDASVGFYRFTPFPHFVQFLCRFYSRVSSFPLLKSSYLYLYSPTTGVAPTVQALLSGSRASRAFRNSGSVHALTGRFFVPIMSTPTPASFPATFTGRRRQSVTRTVVQAPPR